MEKTKIAEAVTKARDTLAEQIVKGLDAQDPTAVAKDLLKDMNKRRLEVIHKLLGFNNSWGNWEVDHCNGRGGESAFGDWVKTNFQDIIEEYFNKNFRHILEEEAVKAAAEMQEAVRKEVRDQLRTRVRNETWKQTEAAAAVIIKEQVEAVVKEFKEAMDEPEPTPPDS